LTDAQVLSKVRSAGADLIACTALSNNFPHVVHLATLIKKEFRAPIIIGGVHPTVAPQETIEENCFDMVCLGEGEETMLEVLETMERGEKSTAVRNIWFKEDGCVIKNELRPLIRDIDTLPPLDYDIYDYPRYLRHHNMVGAFVSSRGCPYLCTYCINHANLKLYRGLGTYVRFRSVEKVIEEVKTSIERYGIHRVEFYDDTFTLHQARIKEFCEKYAAEVGLPFHVNARVDTLTEEMCKDLKKAGCRRVAIGLESGDEGIREKVLKRKISDKQILDGCRLVKKHGMDLYTYNMIGIPHETIRDIKKTIDLNRKIRPDFVNVSIFTAYKGTELYEECRKKGWLDEGRRIDTLFLSTNVKHPNLRLRTLRRLRRTFGFWVFVTHAPARAMMELVDRNLITVPFYSKLRTLAVTRLLRRKEGLGRDKGNPGMEAPQRGKDQGEQRIA